MREVVTMLFPGGSPDIHRVADRMGASARTLQRRLGAAGLTYSGIVQQARSALARRMLEETSRKIGDVARRLGYADPRISRVPSSAGRASARESSAAVPRAPLPPFSARASGGAAAKDEAPI